MSKSMSTRSRVLLRAGLATGAVAALLLGTASVAYAANPTVVLVPTSGPVGGGTSVVGTFTAFMTGFPTPQVRFNTAATCPTTAGAVTATNMAATVTNVTNDAVTFTTPVIGLGAYRVCFYAGQLTTSPIAGNAVFTGVAATPVASPLTGAHAGGVAIDVTGAGPYLTSATTLGATFNTAACPTTYTITGTNTVATASKSSATVAAVTSPAGLASTSVYRICVYNGTTVGTSALLGATAASYSPLPPTVALSAVTGPNGGGNSMTATFTGLLTSVTTPGVNFSVAACPVTYSTSPANLALTATKTSADVATFSVPAGVLAPNVYNVCIYNGTSNGVSNLIGSGGPATYSVTLPSIVLSPPVGPTGGTNTITATSSTAYLTGYASPGVTFSEAACPSTYTTTGSNFASLTVTKISNFKVAALVPVTVVLAGAETLTDYNTCIYTGTGGSAALVASAGAYAVAPILTVASILPTGGPAQGGSPVEITGGGFPYPAAPGEVTVSLGGSPLTDVVVNSATSITGITTAHAAGVTPVSVTTAAGTVSLAAAFTFSNGITVTPNTAAPSTSTFLDVLGVGFSALTFGGATNSTNAHVYLVDGAYDNQDTVALSKDGPQVAECTGVLKISDVEVICTLNTALGLNADGTASGSPVPIGTYTVTVVSNGAIDATPITQSIISSGSTFTVSPY
jgi:hypothetical protein